MANKKAAVIYYSQSGQLKEIAGNFTKSFLEQGVSVEWVRISPEKEFPFPWSGKEFFDAMPESVLGIPAPIKSPVFQHEQYDLIIFAFTPWYLSPSIPATSAIHHPEFRKRLKGAQVVTLIGARNMWISAHEKMKTLLKAAGANIIGSVVLADRNPNLLSAITIQYWMFTGKKEKMWGLFPLPGISQEDISSAGIFGKIVLEHLQSGNRVGLQEKLVNAKGMEINTNLMFVESRATKIFSLWANLIFGKNNRTALLRVFKYYLVIALFLIAPIVLFIYTLFVRPFSQKKIQRQKNYYLGLN